MAGQRDAATTRRTPESRKAQKSRGTGHSARASSSSSSSASSGSSGSPFVIDVIRLRRSPGAMVSIADEVSSPARIGMDMVAVPAGATLRRTLRLESVSEGILVTGTVGGSVVGECARCLGAMNEEVVVELTELFIYPDRETGDDAQDDELARVVDDTVDIEQSVIDAIALVLPFSPLCRPDCPGLCPDCGVSLTEAGPEHHHDRIDPRWAKLADRLGDPGAGPGAPADE